jgi:hypothetical protein
VPAKLIRSSARAPPPAGGSASARNNHPNLQESVLTNQRGVERGGKNTARQRVWWQLCWSILPSRRQRRPYLLCDRYSGAPLPHFSQRSGATRHITEPLASPANEDRLTLARPVRTPGMSPSPAIAISGRSHSTGRRPKQGCGGARTRPDRDGIDPRRAIPDLESRWPPPTPTHWCCARQATLRHRFTEVINTATKPQCRLPLTGQSAPRRPNAVTKFA